MSTEVIIGIVAGGGWGTFIGFILGATWFKRLLSEIAEQDERKE